MIDVVARIEKNVRCHSHVDLLFRHCEKNYVVIRRSNPVKNSDLQNFFIIFFGFLLSQE
nr:hypothetical protein [Rickettsia felis]